MNLSALYVSEVVTYSKIKIAREVFRYTIEIVNIGMDLMIAKIFEKVSKLSPIPFLIAILRMIVAQLVTMTSMCIIP